MAGVGAGSRLDRLHNSARGTVLLSPGWPNPSVSDPYSSNPDPAKNLNPDPERPRIRILAISLHYLKKN